MNGQRLDPDETAVPETNLAHAIAGLRLSESDRWMATEALTKGESISELVYRALKGVRAAANAASRLLPDAEPASDQTQA